MRWRNTVKEILDAVKSNGEKVPTFALLSKQLNNNKK